MSQNLRAKAAEQIEQTLKTDLERTSGVENRLNGQLAQLTRAAGSATPRLQRANDLATDIARLQARFTTVDEQFRNLTIDNAAPGAVYLSAPAIAPLHADRKKIYRNALIVLLAGIIFALGAALIAHNLDPRIYIAADVERVLGFAPMALLPDLYEVGTGVAEEYTLRLAAAVEHAHQQGHLNSCIFTGVAPGAGATTVSRRVSNMLQAMGRSTALVDAVGMAPEEDVDPGSDLLHMPRGSRSTALLQQMTGANRETIVVTDTAPLPISGETEYLARFVDSAIVVIESGTTTKAQLREVAQTLERLDVAAVGFVLNRITMAKGNAAFRQSVHAVEKHLKAQARSFDRKLSRGLAPAGDAAETAERPTAYQRLLEAVSEPANRAAATLEDEPRNGKEFVPARETISVNQPQGAAEEEPAARAARAETSAGRQAESLMPPEKGEKAAAEDARREMNPFEPRTEDADGFLPWEAEAPADLRARFARTMPPAYTGESAGAGGEASIGDSAPESTPEDAGSPPLHGRTAQESATEPDYAAFLKDPLQPAAVDAVETPVSSPAADSGENRAQSWNATPAKPARGREGVQVVLGGPRSAPLTGEEVPDAWRERLRQEAETADPVVLPLGQETQAAASASAESLEMPLRRPDPFAEMREARERRKPLKEWWEELVAPLQQASAADAAVPEDAPVPVEREAAAQAAATSNAGSITENDEALYIAASRLSGLRNLLVSLGIETLHKGVEQRKAEAQSEAQTEREAQTGRLPERAIYAQPVDPDASGDQPGDSVTARPEIIPPRFNAETAERKKAAKTPKTPKTPVKSLRVNSWEIPDDVEILPARRGQYRRNH